MPTIHVACLPTLLPAGGQPIDIAVVIDTLRFTTTACQAIAVGASQIVVAAEVEAARNLAKFSPEMLLCGERLCRPIAGFHLGNSPLEYTSSSVAARPLIFTTTNGTLAVQAAASAEQVILGSLVNRTAAAKQLDNRDAWIICSGTDGQIAGEDLLAAGAIITALQTRHPSTRLGNDSAMLACEIWRGFEFLEPDLRSAKIVESMRRFAGGHNLIENGYEQDLLFAAHVDSVAVVPHNVPNDKVRFVA
ncbi:MAG: 2-phosphosulfolactate phosphatase [Pirellulaceae bacterium]